jgi:hypothetical protein
VNHQIHRSNFRKPTLVRSTEVCRLLVFLGGSPKPLTGRRPVAQHFCSYNSVAHLRPCSPERIAIRRLNQRKTSPKAFLTLPSPSLTRFTLFNQFINCSDISLAMIVPKGGSVTTKFRRPCFLRKKALDLRFFRVASDSCAPTNGKYALI